MAFTRKELGHGVGMRNQHYPRLLEEKPAVDWLEVISENFMVPGGRPLAVLEKVRRDVPVVLHGVSLSIGGTDVLNAEYLKQLKALAARVQPAWVSDHLCWGTHGGHYAHDLLPMPYTEEALSHVVSRVTQVQEALGRQILLENVSSYVSFKEDEMPEWEFVAALAQKADCGILLDVNNVYVNAMNHGFAWQTYLDAIPRARVGQIHLAGHSDKGTHLLDTHDHEVPESVWAIYRSAVERFGRVPTLVEWDDQVPAWELLLAERNKAVAEEARVLEAK